MTEQQSSYRQIMKATSLFGGVQAFNILISLVRSKFVAVLLGPAGMGIIGLLNATTGIIGNLTNFGLGTSAVRDISAALGTKNENRIATVVTVVRKLVWITGLLGFIVTAIFAPWLSQLTFGNKEYTLAFIWISITLLFNQLSSGRLVVLQGLRKLKDLAKANLVGSFIGLLVIIPIYYFRGIDGIVPAIICTAFISMISAWYFSKKIKIQKVPLTKHQTVTEGRNMLKMGFMISLNGLLVLGASYIIRIFISRTGSVEQVGLYNAGFAIINTYVSLIFNAMATDYYPRLSAVADNNEQCRQTINQQAEIALLVLAPILTIFLVFINWVIIILYSQRFTPVNEMIQWAAMGMFFKTIGWSIGFIFLAKATTKLFILNELIANSYILGLNMLGYSLWGLTGLGISFMIAYLIYATQVFVVSKMKFGFQIDNKLAGIFLIQFSLLLTAFIAIRLLNKPLAYLAGSVVFALSAWYSWLQLEKRIGIKKILQNLMKKY